MSAIRLNAVTKSFGKSKVLSDISLDVEHRERLVVLGPSGSGKTTLLRMIAGLETPASGSIWIDGDDVTHLPAARRGVAMVFQDYAVYPQLTVADNLRTSLSKQHLAAGIQRERIAETLVWFHLTELELRKPSQLSGGQLQRVALAKAVINRPRILLLDEPFSQLDASLREELRELLLRIHSQFSLTMITVTHDALDALRLADRVAILERGTLLESGETLQTYAHPGHRTTANLLSPLGLNLLEVKNQTLPVGCFLADRLADNLDSGISVIAFRPEVVQQNRCDIPIADCGLRIKGHVCGLQSLGFAQLASVRVGETVIRVLLPRNSPIPVGDTELQVAAGDLFWF